MIGDEDHVMELEGDELHDEEGHEASNGRDHRCQAGRRRSFFSTLETWHQTRTLEGGLKHLGLDSSVPSLGLWLHLEILLTLNSMFWGD